MRIRIVLTLAIVMVLAIISLSFAQGYDPDTTLVKPKQDEVNVENDSTINEEDVFDPGGWGIESGVESENVVHHNNSSGRLSGKRQIKQQEVFDPGGWGARTENIDGEAQDQEHIHAIDPGLQDVHPGKIVDKPWKDNQSLPKNNKAGTPGSPIEMIVKRKHFS